MRRSHLQRECFQLSPKLVVSQHMLNEKSATSRCKHDCLGRRKMTDCDLTKYVWRWRSGGGGGSL